MKWTPRIALSLLLLIPLALGVGYARGQTAPPTDNGIGTSPSADDEPAAVQSYPEPLLAGRSPCRPRREGDLVVQFLGSFYCDHCSGEYRVPTWLLNGARLCATHFRHITGHEPPAEPRVNDPAPPEPAPAAPAWQRLVPGLRMRRAEATPGLELQGVRNLRIGEATSTVGDTAVWTLNDEQLVDLVLAASAHRDDPAPNKAVVRIALLRILHGTEKP